MKIPMIVIIENDKNLFENRTAARGTFWQGHLILNKTVEVIS